MSELTKTKAYPRALVSALAEPWLMAEDRVKAVFAQVQSLPAQAYSPADEECTEAVARANGYHVSGGVATIEVCGVLTKYATWYDECCGFCPAMPIIDALARAMADWTVRSIVFLIDSPGGMVAGTNMLAEAIAAANKVKPCHAVVSDMAASGGYYVASQCRSITCNAMGQVGCIGVYCVLTDDSKFWEDMGVTFHVASSGGVKGLGADGKVSQELIDEEKRGVMAIYDKFIADVAAGRGLSIDESRNLGDGRMWIASQAKQLGLIDSVASVGDATAAIIKETYSMTSEQVKAFAAENPDDTAVKDIRVAGHRSGAAEARTAENNRLKGIVAASPNRPQLAIDSFLAGQEPEQVALTIKALDDESAKAKVSADAAAAENARLKAELDKAQKQAAFANDGQRPLNTTGAAANAASDAAKKEAANADFEKIEGHAARAKAEWAADFDGCTKAFAKESVYVGYRTAELAGQIKSHVRQK